MVLVSQTNTTRLVWLQAVPFCQQIESCYSEGEPCMKVSPHAMSHVLDMTHLVQHRKHSLNHHAGVPSTTLTHQHVGGIATLQVEGVVGQHHHLLFKLGYHWL